MGGVEGRAGCGVPDGAGRGESHSRQNNSDTVIGARKIRGKRGGRGARQLSPPAARWQGEGRVGLWGWAITKCWRRRLLHKSIAARSRAKTEGGGLMRMRLSPLHRAAGGRAAAVAAGRARQRHEGFADRGGPQGNEGGPGWSCLGRAADGGCMQKRAASAGALGASRSGGARGTKRAGRMPRSTRRKEGVGKRCSDGLGTAPAARAGLC